MRRKERVNNPPLGLVSPDRDKDTSRKTYVHHFPFAENRF